MYEREIEKGERKERRERENRKTDKGDSKHKGSKIYVKTTDIQTRPTNVSISHMRRCNF